LIFQIEFQEASGGNGQLLLNNGKTKNTKKRTVSRQVPCFSLETMLLALNQTHVDYFSLDVEGFELDVLKTIPFYKVGVEHYDVDMSFRIYLIK
jgi:FkbM family methyltransferase